MEIETKLMEIRDIVNLPTAISMRREVLKVAIAKELPEELIWNQIEIYRKIHPRYKGKRACLRVGEIMTNAFSVISDSGTPIFTDSPIEAILKHELLARGVKFEMGRKIGYYIADFFFKEASLIVEADGRDYHSSPKQIKRDEKRDRYLMKRGYTVVRFSGKQIYGSVQTCVARILQLLGG